MAPGCATERRQDGGWQFKYCWQLDGTLKHTGCLNIVADKVSSVMEILYLNGNWIFQQDNVTCHSAWIVQEWFEEHNFSMSGKSEPWRPCLKFTGLRGCAASFLVPDTTAHFKRSCGVHASIGAQTETYTISGSYNVMAGMLTVFCTPLLTPVIITYLEFIFY